MAPRPHLLKDRPSKLKRLQNAKNKKKKPEGWFPPNTAPLMHCGCQEWDGPPYLVEKKSKPNLVHRRNPGRMDGVLWNGSTFICAPSVEGGRTTYEVMVTDPVCMVCVEAEVQADWEQSLEKRDEDNRMTVQLEDIAVPAKVKGIAKEFEVLQRVPQVIALNDDSLEALDEDDGSEDWEDVYVDDLLKPNETRTYSDVLRGGDL